MRNLSTLKAAVFSALLTLPIAAFAQSMPWEDPICKIANSFSGPVAVAFVILAVIFCGAMLAFGELNGIFKSLLGVAIGGAMAVGAVQWTVMFTGASRLGCLTASAEPATTFAQALLPFLTAIPVA